jgi:hypothetical protein
MTNEEFERILETNPPATALQGEIGYQDLALFAEWLMQTIHAMRETMPRWIPVSEGLPEVNTPVLGLYREYFDHGEIQMTVLLNYGGEGWTEFNDNDTYYTGITHWMPLPPLPKEMK